MPDILAQLRQQLTKRGWQAYILPSKDQHQSHYLGKCDERVKFVSGFSGSNAMTLISQTEALLWTQASKAVQAKNELHQGWQLRKFNVGEIMWDQHIVRAYPQSTIGIDPRLFTAFEGIIQIEILKESGIKVELSIDNIVDRVWTTRPKQKPHIFIHEQWAGKSISQKVNWVRANITQRQGKSAIFNNLSEIAWILNLRSSQIPHSPFFKGVLIIRTEGGSLYLPKGHPSLNSQEIQQHLAKQKILLEQCQPKFEERTLFQKPIYHSSKLNYHIYCSIEDKHPIEWEGIDLYRAVKTEKELNGFTRCHIVDGVAMAKFWGWRCKLDEVHEYEAALYINARRYEQEHNKGLSFETVSAGGPNAGIINYHTSQTTHSIIKKNMIHLLDSGGQYLDGTTTVTRTFHFGNPTPQEKDSFTRVLLGNLDIERLRWPAGKLTGGDIDILARRHLWAKGLDYVHGIGHGVGHFGGECQWPNFIQYRQAKFVTGMILNNEAAYFKRGQFGIRIGNILSVTEQNGFNWFENMTLCPYDKNLISKELITKNDEKFINQYHKRVWDTLSPKLQGSEEALSWLKHATSPL